MRTSMMIAVALLFACSTDHLLVSVPVITAGVCDGLPNGVGDDLGGAGDAGDRLSAMPDLNRVFAGGTLDANDCADCFAVNVGPHTRIQTMLIAHEAPGDAVAGWYLYEPLESIGVAQWPNDRLSTELSGPPAAGSSPGMSMNVSLGPDMPLGDWVFCLERAAGSGNVPYDAMIYVQDFGQTEDDLGLLTDAGDTMITAATLPDDLPDGPLFDSSWGALTGQDDIDCVTFNRDTITTISAEGEIHIDVSEPGDTATDAVPLPSGEQTTTTIPGGHILCLSHQTGLDDPLIYQLIMR